MASLTPAGTEMILAIDPRVSLVAVSNYCVDPRIDRLPRAGDYLRADWEKLAALRPKHLIVQGRPDRLPAGLDERARELGITLVAIQVDRLEDVFTQIRKIGSATDRAADAAALEGRLRARLDAVRQGVDGRAEVDVLLVVGDQPTNLVGPGTYLDDLLQIAGGRNVLGDSRRGYPTVDLELLSTLSPAVIIQLMPNATDAHIEAAWQKWHRLGSIPAVRDGRIEFVTDRKALLPGPNVVELAETFAGRIAP